jgi:hypothetical protein
MDRTRLIPHEYCLWGHREDIPRLAWSTWTVLLHPPPPIARSTFSRSSRVAAICFEAPVCRCTATILVTGVCLVMQWRDTSEMAKKSDGLLVRALRAENVGTSTEYR